MKPILTLLLLCILHSAFGQTRYDSIFSQEGNRRTGNLLHALVSQRDTPVELVKINALVREKGNITDETVDGFMAALRKFNRDSTSFEKAEPLLRQYLLTARKLKDHYLKGIIYYNIGEYARVRGLHNEAFENKLYALREFETDPAKHFYGESWMVHQIASEYYLFHDYDKVLYLLKRLYLENPPPGWDTWFAKMTGNLIGMSHLKNNQIDSAKVWFEKTHRLAVLSNDSAWQGISYGNIGNVYLQQKEYAAAIPYYRDALAHCKPQMLWDNVAPFSSNLAYCLLMTNQLTEIPGLLKDAKEAIAKDSYHTFANFLSYFASAQAYYRKTGNYLLALDYADSLAEYTVKENEQYNVNKKLQAEAQMAYRNKEVENEMDLQKVKQSRLLLYGLGIVTVLLLAIVILFFTRRQLKHKMRNAQLEFERHKAAEELSLSMTEIRDYTKDADEKNDLILEYLMEIDRLKQKLGSLSAEDDEAEKNS